MHALRARRLAHRFATPQPNLPAKTSPFAPRVAQVGTCQLAIIAHAYRKPFYVAAESFKFARHYPLHQRDIQQPRPAPLPTKGEGEGAPARETNPLLTRERLTRDYTAPKYINLLFTDLGVLTPSAVSDELIKLYY